MNENGSGRAVSASFLIVGDGTTTQFTFSHSWGTYNVIFSLYDASTHDETMAAVQFTSGW
jgi:hypothetical protein